MEKVETIKGLALDLKALRPMESYRERILELALRLIEKEGLTEIREWSLTDTSHEEFYAVVLQGALSFVKGEVQGDRVARTLQAALLFGMEIYSKEGGENPLIVKGFSELVEMVLEGASLEAWLDEKKEGV